MGRRCFSDKIVESDSFFALPENAQTLYFHLNMNADDDGFVNNAVSVAGKVKAGKAALKKLVDARFLLQFGDVFVVKHWRISNSLKNDRLKPLNYAGLAARVWVKPNRAYTDHPVAGCKTLYETKTGCAPQGELESKMESNWNPFGILTEPNITEPNITEPNLTEMASVFEQLISEYPDGNVGKRESAWDAYRQVIQDPVQAREALENLRLWRRSEQWNKEGGKYIPYFSNWLLRGTWHIKPKPMAGSGPRELDEDEIAAIRRMMAADYEDGI